MPELSQAAAQRFGMTSDCRYQHIFLIRLLVCATTSTSEELLVRVESVPLPAAVR